MCRCSSGKKKARRSRELFQLDKTTEMALMKLLTAESLELYLHLRGKAVFHTNVLTRVPKFEPNKSRLM